MDQGGIKPTKGEVSSPFLFQKKDVMKLYCKSTEKVIEVSGTTAGMLLSSDPGEYSVAQPEIKPAAKPAGKAVKIEGDLEIKPNKG